MIEYAIPFGLAIYGAYRITAAVRTPILYNKAFAVTVTGFAVAFFVRAAWMTESADTMLSWPNLVYDVSSVLAGCGVILSALSARQRIVPRRAVRTQLVLCAVVVAVMLSSFLTVREDPASRRIGISAYSITMDLYAVGFATAGVLLCIRHFRPTEYPGRCVGVALMGTGAGLGALAAVIALGRDLPNLFDRSPANHHSPMLMEVAGGFLLAGMVVIFLAVRFGRRSQEERSIDRLWRSLVQRQPDVRLPARFRGLPLGTNEIARTRRIIEIEDALATLEVTKDLATLIRDHEDPSWALGVALRDEASYAPAGAGTCAAELIPEPRGREKLDASLIARVAAGFEAGRTTPLTSRPSESTVAGPGSHEESTP